MKKIIIGIILVFLGVGNAWADMVMPGGEWPNYNEGCRTLCMIVTGDGPTCNDSCVSGHVEYIDIVRRIPMIPQLILFFPFFYFLLNKFFGKQFKKNNQKIFLFSVFSIILSISLIISLRLLYFYNNQPPDFSFSDNPHGRNSINIGRKNPI